jgi:hypothetical protein
VADAAPGAVHGTLALHCRTHRFSRQDLAADFFNAPGPLENVI